MGRESLIYKRNFSEISIRRKLAWNDIDLDNVRKIIELSLYEDLGKNNARTPHDGDLSTKYSNIKGTGMVGLSSRQSMTVCGLELIPMISELFSAQNLVPEIYYADSSKISADTIFASLKGNINDILLIERTVLNFIQHLSGIASYTSRLVSKTDKYGVGLLDTRKTTPGYRQLEKYATSCGGSFNHRIGLNERILIKDNHLASKNIQNVDQLRNFAKTLRTSSKDYFVQIEVDTIDQALSLTKEHTDAILLDNFSINDLKKVLEARHPEVIIEVSGGITLDNIEEYAACKPDFISTGSPTHQSTWIDIGMDWLN